MGYPQRDIDKPYSRMYCSDGNIGNQGGSRNPGRNLSTIGNNSYYGEIMPYMDEYPIKMRDYTEEIIEIANQIFAKLIGRYA